MVTSNSLLSAVDEENSPRVLVQPGLSYIHSRVGYYQSYPTNEISVFEGYLGITKDLRNWLTVGLSSHLTRFKGQQLGTEAVGLRSFARWHFLSRKRFSTYLEAGFGIAVTEAEFPPGGTQFNFTEVGGIGLTHRITEDVNLLIGIRHYHLSNGDLIGGNKRNPGFDGNGLYIGYQFKLGRE
jgi:hypothetical protein